MWYFGHKRRPLSWPVSPGFFVVLLHWKSGGLMKLSRVNHLNLPSLEVKNPKHQQKKIQVQVPKYFKNPDSVSRHERKKKCASIPTSQRWFFGALRSHFWGLCTFTAHQLGHLRELSGEKRAAKKTVAKRWRFPMDFWSRKMEFKWCFFLVQLWVD